MSQRTSRLLGIALALLLIAALAAITVQMRKHLDDKVKIEPRTLSMPNDTLSSLKTLKLGYDEEVEAALVYLDEHWQPGYTVMLLECFRQDLLLRRREPVGKLLSKKTGQNFSVMNREGLFQWMQWVWNQPYVPAPEYVSFKRWLYSERDSHFAAYFPSPIKASIRLDEVVWGGVGQDGIPPLDHPPTVTAAEATYLDDSNIVFGIEIQGHARAYPQRILGHHEMVRDRLGDMEIAGVYCTLCGTMIAYNATVGDETFLLGTSGFLYRSNKLMYDGRTESLWSTLSGEPVLGELVDRGLKLSRIPIVNTTWGQWKKLHPASTVLSIPPGDEVKYAEGRAYAEYFATDEVMFPVPSIDPQLANKAEVLALHVPDGDERLAISNDFLKDHPVFHENLGTIPIVVLTDAGGGNRVFESGAHRFTSLAGTKATDTHGAEWQVTESAMIGPDGVTLPRLPAHRAFWFGWQAAFPETRLVK